MSQILLVAQASGSRNSNHNLPKGPLVDEASTYCAPAHLTSASRQA